MPVILPFRPSIENYRFSAILNNEEYIFDVRWHDRESAWYFDVREADDQAIVYGIKIVLGVYFGRRSVHHLFSNGAMVARVAGEDRSEARFDDLGVRIQIWYFTRAEAIQEIMWDLQGRPK